MIRAAVFAIITTVALCGFIAAIHWNDDRHPLAIDAAGGNQR